MSLENNRKTRYTKCRKCNTEKNIRMHQILNVSICSHCISEPEYKMITIKEAKANYNITKRYLKKLKNNNGDCENTLLYLESDIRQLQMEKNNNVYVAYKKILFTRVEQLRKYNVPIQDEIHPKLWRYVIENYLDNSVKTPKIDIKTILERGLASVRITNSNVPKNIYLIYYFIQDKDNDPNQIFRNAIEYSKLKINTFNAVTCNISKYLTRDEQKNWVSSYIEEDYAIKLNRQIRKLPTI